MTDSYLPIEDSAADNLSDSDSNIIQTAKGGGISFVGQLFVFVFRFFFGLILARILGAELLGMYTLTSTIIDVIAVVALLGLGAAIVRYIPIAINQKDDARLWGIIQVGVFVPFAVSFILAICLFLSADWVANTLFNRPDLAPLLRIASVGVPLFALMSELASVTQAFKRMEYEVYSVNIAFNLSKLIFSVVFLLLGLSVVGVLIAQNIGLAIAVGMLFYFVHQLFPLKRPINQAKRDFRELFSFSFPVYLTRVLNNFSGSLEALVLGVMGLVSGIGIYTTAMRISGIGGIFHRSLQKIAMPMISDLYSRQETDQLKRFYRTTTKWDLTFNLPIFLTITFFAAPLMSIFGDEFSAGTTGLIILAFGTLFNTGTGVCGAMITMTGHTRLTFLNSIINVAINIVLDILLIPKWGIIGAALAITLTIMVINTLRTIQVYYLHQIFPYDWTFLKPVAAAIISSIIVYILISTFDSINDFVLVVIGSVILWGSYIAMVYLLRLSDEDRLILDRFKDRIGFLKK
jgi:O-antigen/teichoic acid export membrane protein